VLGLDLGCKRIGVAVSDADEVLASPFGTLARSGDRRRDHRAIAALVAEEEAGCVVVGLPLSLDGTDGPAAEAARAEVDELAAGLAVPVVLHDERLTTVEAHRRLAEQGLDERARRKVVDQVAAAVMLQAWLDARRAQPGREDQHG
jgi:putative Holliday junction resolvase